jgi:hypothetical protein
MKSKCFLKISAIVLSIFALLTFFLTFSIFFNLFGIRESEGNYVLFVVIGNFICSLLYIMAAYGFWNKKKWTSRFLAMATALLAIVLIVFLFYINTGGLYEDKTIKALIFRLIITGFFWFISFKYISLLKK